MQAQVVGFTRRLAILTPERALGRRSVHKAGFNGSNASECGLRKLQPDGKVLKKWLGLHCNVIESGEGVNDSNF